MEKYVIKNKEKVKMSYEDICRELNCSPDIHFVEVTKHGTITFTCGKPDEIRYLLYQCVSNGYKPAKRLSCMAKI